jgi:hypothetical protein
VKQERIELNDRFIQALDWLESTGVITRYSHRKENTDSKSYSDLAVIMGDGVANLPTSRIADFRNRKRFVDYPEAIRFSIAFAIRKEWMVFGDGPMKEGHLLLDILYGTPTKHPQYDSAKSWADLPSLSPTSGGKTVNLIK